MYPNASLTSPLGISKRHLNLHMLNNPVRCCDFSSVPHLPNLRQWHHHSLKTKAQISLSFLFFPQHRYSVSQQLLSAFSPKYNVNMPTSLISTAAGLIRAVVSLPAEPGVSSLACLLPPSPSSVAVMFFRKSYHSLLRTRQ